jgi:hypothetical protein
LTTTRAPSLASFSAMARPMPRPDPVISATFPSSLAISFLLMSDCDHGFAGEFDVAVLVFCRQRQSRAALAFMFDELGDMALAGQARAELRDRDEAGCEMCAGAAEELRRSGPGQDRP